MVLSHLFIAGHGKQKDGSFDPGASGYIKKGEHKYVKEDLFPAMKKYVPKGEKVIFFSDHKVNSYGDLVALAKKYNAKTVTEVHFDAHTLGSSARGGHVIVHSNFKPDKVDLALRDAIKKMVGVRYSHKGHEGISGRNNLYNVNVAAQNGVNYRLIELGFGTNKTDADIMVKKVDEYAKELIKAVTGSVASKSNTNTSTSNKKPSNSAKSNAKGDMKTGSIVVYLQSIGEPYSFAHRQKLAAKHGIKNYTGTASQNKRLLSILRGSKASNKPSNTNTSSKPKTSTTASIKRMADEVIAGKHGSGHANRRKSLGVDQATYEKVRAEVNRRSGVKTASKGKSISQMATEVLAGKHGNGHANRRRSLGVNQATYDKVRAEVNRRS